MKNGDQPAYPLDPGKQPGLNAGLTKRELIAAMAMQGILSNSISQESMMPQDAAYRAILCADELIKQLEQK